MESPLAPYRALDLSDEKGAFCGKILGDLGADVIKIEPPGGDSSRNIGPFYHDIRDPEKSLFWFAYNASKRGITLNIETSEGQHLFKKLAKTADFVIESFPPGHMNKLGLGYPALSEINPRIIAVSITPFGQTGPYKDCKACDIVTMAMGGLMYVTGDRDRPPIRITVPQAYPHAGAQAAMGALVAHYCREVTGEGQHVDVSMQEAVLRALLSSPAFWEYSHVIASRLGALNRRGNIYQREAWPCRDGQVCFRLMGGTYFRGVQPLIEWMEEEGVDRTLGEKIKALDSTKASQEESDNLERALSDFFLKHTAAELYEQALKRGFALMPGYTPKDIMASGQLAARDYWLKIEHPELGVAITYPGAPYTSYETPYQVQCRAPLIGEHNRDIYVNELGLSEGELLVLKERNVV